MVTLIRFAPSALAIAALLSGCGGEGGSSGPSTTSGAPTSSPAPAAAPGPTASSDTYPSAPANANGPVMFDAVGWRKDHKTGAITELSNAQFAMRWDGTSIYETSISDIGSGRLRYFFGRSSNPNIFSIERSDGVIIPVGISWIATEPLLQAPASASFHYPASGIAPSPPTELSGALVLGRMTEPASIPAVGIRSYRFKSEGVGTATVDADFGARSISVTFAVSYRDAWGPYEPLPAAVSDATLAPDRRSFSARYTLAGIPGEGELKGWFFGPDAQYVGLTWKGPMREPYDNKVYDIFGAWRLDRPT